MLSKESELIVTDNTGAKRAKIIGTTGPACRKRAFNVGDIVKVAIKVSTPDATVKKGTVATAVIVRTKYPTRRPDGSYLRFGDNACVIVNADLNPKGTRILGPVARELRQKEKQRNFTKIISLALEVL